MATPSTSSLRIVAAGRGRTMSHPRIVETVIRMTGEERPKLVYLGTATYDKDEPFQIQAGGYHNQCQVVKLDVSEAVNMVPSSAEIENTLQSAHIVMVSGGNTLYAMNRWKALGVDEALRRIASEGVVLCGGSAGAICWFEHGHSDSMDPSTFLHVDPNLTEEQKKDWQYVRVQGLGLLPAMCVPHHDSTQTNGVPRSLDSDSMMLEHSEQCCLGIDETAAFVVENGLARVLSTDDVGQCYLKQCIETREGYDVVAQALNESHGPILLEELWRGNVLD